MDGHVTGYASIFGLPDLGRDTVMRGAFANSLARRGASGVRMLWQHDPAEPIGRWLSLTEDRKGLRVEGKLNLAVQRAREVAALIREGGLDGLSIGFRVIEAVPERGGRRLVALDLWEVSLVTFPLQPGARVVSKAAASLQAQAQRMRSPQRPTPLPAQISGLPEFCSRLPKSGRPDFGGERPAWTLPSMRGAQAQPKRG